MKVLITGAAGLYGINLLNNLVQLDQIEQVIGVDNYSRYYNQDLLNTSWQINKKVTWLKKDFQSLSIKEMNTFDIDAVIHLAAFTSMDESMETPEEYFLNNEYGFFKFLQVLLRTKKQPLLIYASCCQVYGNPRYVPVDVEHPLDAQGVFGVTKLAGEKYCLAMNQWYNYPIIIIRNTNTYGPYQSLNGYVSVVPNFIARALNEENLVVYNDGSQRRDFLYVKDAVRAYEMVLLKGPKLVGETFNIGTGKAITIKKLAEKIIKISGASSEIIYLPEKKEAEVFESDISLITRKTGWTPQYTIDQGLKETIDWYKTTRRC